MSWNPVSRTVDLPVGEKTVVTVEGQRLVVFRLSETEASALVDVCSHDDGPLGQGSFSGTVIECPRHGAQFDVRTGAVLRMPAASPVEAFPARVNGEWIEVDFEEVS